MPPATPPRSSVTASATWLCPTSTTGSRVSASDSAAASSVSTYSHTGSRALAWNRSAPSRCATDGSGARNERDSSSRTAADHRADAAADERDTIVGVRPVADDVAEAPQLVRRLLVDRGEHRLERG